MFTSATKHHGRFLVLYSKPKIKTVPSFHIVYQSSSNEMEAVQNGTHKRIPAEVLLGSNGSYWELGKDHTGFTSLLTAASLMTAHKLLNVSPATVDEASSDYGHKDERFSFYFNIFKLQGPMYTVEKRNGF
jgi:hypothetical protein